MTNMRFTDLSVARRLFVRECQRIGFGTISSLIVSAGEPDFGEETEILLDLKLDADCSPRPELNLQDFILSAELLRLFRQFDSIGDGVVEQIEIRAGLPRRALIRVSRSQSEVTRTPSQGN